MTLPIHRFRTGAVYFGIVLVIAICGYRFFRDSWLDAIYMVVITISSVGFGETSSMPAAEKVFTIAVVLFGMSAAAYALGGLLQMMTEGELSAALGKHRMTRGIDKLKGHVIVCGFGRIGRMLAQEFHEQGQEFVLIDKNADELDEARAHEYLYMAGDATEESVLITAGVERASAIVSGLPNDAANVFIALTSRNLNQRIQIVTRAEHRSSEKKLLQAGANRVVMPSSIGAERMARLVMRPRSAAVLERMVGRDFLDVELDEIVVQEDSGLAGRTIADTPQLKQQRLLIVGLIHDNGQMIFNPAADQHIAVGDTLVVMGRPDGIQELRRG